VKHVIKLGLDRWSSAEWGNRILPHASLDEHSAPSASRMRSVPVTPSSEEHGGDVMRHVTGQCLSHPSALCAILCQGCRDRTPLGWRGAESSDVKSWMRTSTRFIGSTVSMEGQRGHSTTRVLVRQNPT